MLLWGLLVSTAVQADGVDKVESAVKKVLSSHGADKDEIAGVYNRVFGDHGKLRFMDHNGKKYIVLLIREENGPRCTRNFDRNWDGIRSFTVYLLNVAPKERSNVNFQLMKDNGGQSVDTVECGARHGRPLSMRSGDKRYFSKQNFDAGKLTADSPYAALLLIEKGLTTGEVASDIEGMAK